MSSSSKLIITLACLGFLSICVITSADLWNSGRGRAVIPLFVLAIIFITISLVDMWSRQ